LASPAARPSLGAAAGPGPGPATGVFYRSAGSPPAPQLLPAVGQPGLDAWPGRQPLQGWRWWRRQFGSSRRDPLRWTQAGWRTSRRP